MAAKAQIEVKMKQHSKPLKSAVRYEAEDGSKGVGDIYIQKAALGSNPPAEITLTVNW